MTEFATSPLLIEGGVAAKGCGSLAKGWRSDGEVSDGSIISPCPLDLLVSLKSGDVGKRAVPAAVNRNLSPDSFWRRVGAMVMSEGRAFFISPV